MKSILACAAFLLMGSMAPLAAEDVNLNNWTDDFKKVATGARDDVQYNLYRKTGDPQHIYVELINRRASDVKVDLRLVAKYKENDRIVPLTGFVKAKGFWPNGYDRRIACDFKEPDVDIRSVVDGVVEEEQVFETDSDGKEIQRYKYRFKTADAVKAEKKRAD